MILNSLRLTRTATKISKVQHRQLVPIAGKWPHLQNSIGSMFVTLSCKPRGILTKIEWKVNQKLFNLPTMSFK